MKAKKAAPKKRKYFLIFSQATQRLKIKPVGPCILDHYLQLHSIDIVG